MGVKQQFLSRAARSLYVDYSIQAKYYQFTNTHQSLIKLRTTDKNNIQNKHNPTNEVCVVPVFEITKSMEQCHSSGAALSSVTQDFLRIAWKPSVHYRPHNNKPRVLEPDESLFFKINFNIFLPSTFRSSKGSLSFRFQNQKHVCMFLISFLPPYAPTSCPPW